MKKMFFLFFKWPILQRITPRNSLCVNAASERVPQTESIISYLKKSLKVGVHRSLVKQIIVRVEYNFEAFVDSRLALWLVSQHEPVGQGGVAVRESLVVVLK